MRKTPELVKFQIGYLPYGQNLAIEFGACDTIMFVQNKVEMNELSLQTVFPRCIGKSKDWEEFLKNQVSLGYNAFHLAPIQETG